MSDFVVVAHDSETVGELVAGLCREAGYAIRVVRAGREALAFMDQRPRALIVDAALADLIAPEVIEECRRRSPETRVMLLASIYNRSGYKRPPTSLYGADDYVEQQHIPDALLHKLERLIGPPPLPAAAGGGGVVSREAEAHAVDLARHLVEEIVARRGRPAVDEPEEELEARLRLDLEEGRLKFDLRIPKELRSRRDFIAEALAELWQRRRRSE